MELTNTIQLTLNSIFGFIIQLGLFSLIPFLWKKAKHVDESFFRWVGIKKPIFNGKVIFLILTVVVWYMFYTFDAMSFIDPTVIEESDNIASSVYTGMGIYAILPVFIESVFRQAVTEEILFRGFLGKRLIAKFGFMYGNLIQSILFGFMHIVLFVIAGINMGVLEFFLLFITTAAPAFLLGYLNEKLFDGSIIPSILVHGLGNFYSTMRVAFNLL